MQVKVSTFTPPEVVLKRTILLSISKLWDSIGILAPVTLNLQEFLQSLWASNVTWDEPIDARTVAVFLKQMQETNQLQTFWIDRCIKPAISDNFIELHGLCDGSKKDHAAIVWLRTPIDNGYALNFIAAKSYVASLKKKSIPRIELMDAVVLVRLVALIREMFSCRPT